MDIKFQSPWQEDNPESIGKVYDFRTNIVETNQSWPIVIPHISLKDARVREKFRDLNMPVRTKEFREVGNFYEIHFHSEAKKNRLSSVLDPDGDLKGDSEVDFFPLEECFVKGPNIYFLDKDGCKYCCDLQSFLKDNWLSFNFRSGHDRKDPDSIISETEKKFQIKNVQGGVEVIGSYDKIVGEFVGVDAVVLSKTENQISVAHDDQISVYDLTGCATRLENIQDARKMTMDLSSYGTIQQLGIDAHKNFYIVRVEKNNKSSLYIFPIFTPGSGEPTPVEMVEDVSEFLNTDKQGNVFFVKGGKMMKMSTSMDSIPPHFSGKLALSKADDVGMLNKMQFVQQEVGEGVGKNLEIKIDYNYMPALLKELSGFLFALTHEAQNDKNQVGWFSSKQLDLDKFAEIFREYQSMMTCLEVQIDIHPQLALDIYQLQVMEGGERIWNDMQGVLRKMSDLHEKMGRVNTPKEKKGVWKGQSENLEILIGNLERLSEDMTSVSHAYKVDDMMQSVSTRLKKSDKSRKVHIDSSITPEDTSSVHEPALQE